MTDKLKETVYDIEKLGLKNPEPYVLTHIRFIACIVLNFTDLNKTQIYKMLYIDSTHHEIEIFLNFNYLKLFKTK